MEKDKRQIEIEVEKTLAFLDQKESLQTSPFFYSRLDAKIQRLERTWWQNVRPIRLSAIAVPVVGFLFILINLMSTAWLLNDNNEEVYVANDNYLTTFAEEYTPSLYYASYISTSSLGE